MGQDILRDGSWTFEGSQSFLCTSQPRPIIPGRHRRVVEGGQPQKPQEAVFKMMEKIEDGKGNGTSKGSSMWYKWQRLATI